MSFFSLRGTKIIMNGSQIIKNYYRLCISLINISLGLIYGNLRLKRKQCFVF